ncbi:uncharacterized protein LOC112559205 isoform X2 [Pomacea canaliculata]|uniref:uncharacterized protein LOC112559205 isoform X2 n=1 Tax=Pomacea canaliculata TaxID=400727 RepID=UPI000D73B0F2|nr:uncharacterized protein LOC112559205 isoform X2 [Pomacea canaliculata]
MRGVIKKMAERDLSFRAERSVRHFSSQSPFTIGFCSPPVTQHLHHPSPLQTCSPRGLLLQSDMFLCPMFLPETPSSVPGTSPCMSALPLPLPFDWTCQIERFHGVEAVSQYTERSMKHPGRMLETPVFELNNYLPVSLSTDQTSCSLPPPKSHKADANGKEIKLSTSLNPWASDFKPLKERQSMGNSNDIENLNQQTFVKSSQTSSIQICKLKLCRKDDAETKGSSSEGAICVAKEKWNESLQDITGNQYDDVSVQTDELHVIYTKESLHCAKDKTDNSSQTCSRNNGMLLSLRKEAETQTDNHYEHKSLQTEWVTEKQRLHSVDCSDSLQKIAEDLKKEVQKLQIEVCHLRAEQCIKELHRQILTLTQDKMLWQTYFVTGSEAESTVIGIIDERISWLHFEIKRLQKQLSQCLCKFEKGKILSRLPEFFLILPDNNVYRPAASARSASAKTAPSFSDILGSPLSSAGSQSLKSQKFKSQDASKKYMNLAVAESALRKPSQNSCHFSFEDKENLTVFDLQSSPVRQQSYHEHCPVLESSPTVCENGCKKPEKQNYSVTSQICTLDSSLHIITSKNPSLTEVINDDSAKYATCSALTETSDKENENQQFESMAKRMQSEVLVEKSSYNGATESVPGYCNEENTDKHPTKGYLQPSKKLTKTLPHEQTPSDSLKSREIEKPSLYPDAAVSAEDDHRGMSRLAKSDCHLKQISTFATDYQKTERNKNAATDDRFQIQSNYAEYPWSKTSDHRTLPEQSEKMPSKLLDHKACTDMGMTLEQLNYETFQESLDMDSGMLFEQSDQTANNKQNYKIPEKSKALSVNCEHENLCLQMNLKESVVPCFESDFCTVASLPGPAIMNGMNLVDDDALSPAQFSEEALDVARLGIEADKTSMNDKHECHLLKHVSNSLHETFDVDAEDTVLDDGIKLTATAAAKLIDLQQSDRRRDSKLITASSVSVVSSVAEGKKTDEQVESHDVVKVHPSSDLVGHLNATHYTQHAVAKEGDLYNPTSTSAMPTTFLQHHLQPLTLPAALQTTSHAELPSTDLQSSCAVASSMRLISSTLSELDFASDSNSSHSQEPSVQSSSTISSPLQQPGIPASSVIFSSPQGPGIPGLEEILSGTNSLSPCANDLYPIVLTMLTLEYPLQACDRVWLQKTAREQTQLLWTVLQNQQGPLSSLEAAVLKPPLTPGPSSAPASVPRSVKSPCHPQTTPDAPFANQTSLQMSPKTCDIPPGFQKIELQDSSWPGPAIAKKSDDDDDSSRAACQSGARVHKEGSDHPSTVHISHGSFIETPDPQLNSPTSSISLCKNSHDLEFELGCKIQTAGSADQNQTFLTKKNTLENACPTENSGAWEKTGKFCKMDEVKQEERHSKTGNANNLSASCHQKLVRFIMKTSPHLTPEQLSNVIVKVKEEFGGCLHGQLFSNITKKAKFIAMHSYPDVARSMNLASSSCAICHEEMKPQGLQKLTCGHFIHVQCFTKWVAQDRQCPTCQKLVSCPSFSY